jgi:hypothetical protein
MMAGFDAAMARQQVEALAQEAVLTKESMLDGTLVQRVVDRMEYWYWRGRAVQSAHDAMARRQAEAA